MATSKGVEFYAGGEKPDFGSSSTGIPSEPSTKSGGPIEAPEGLDDGSSMSIPDKPGNAAPGMSQGSGSPIKGPMDL